MIPSHHLSLKLIQRCPACNNVFQRTQVTILMETETTVLAHLSCNHCRVNLLANVVQMPQGLVGNAILTDATVDEIQSFLAGPPIDENDFLRLYQFIHSTELFNQISQPGLPSTPMSGNTEQN